MGEYDITYMFQVVDSVTGQPVPYASIQLLMESSGMRVTWATDANGYVSKTLDWGYQFSEATVLASGYSAKTIRVSWDFGKAILNTIMLDPVTAPIEPPPVIPPPVIPPIEPPSVTPPPQSWVPLIAGAGLLVVGLWYFIKKR